MYGKKPFYCNCFIIVVKVLVLAPIFLCIAQENTLQSSSISDKTTAELVTPSKISTKNTDLPKELVSHLNNNQSPAPIQQSPTFKNAIPIACYECNSHKDPECVTQPEKFKTNCTNVNKGSEYKGCWKIDQWVDYDSGDELKAHHRVIRQCAMEGDIKKPCYYRAGFGGRINACFCDKDLCNSAFSSKIVNFNIFLIVISSLLVVYSQ